MKKEKRPATLADLPALRALDSPIWREDLRDFWSDRIGHFPAGSFVASADGILVGAASCMRFTSGHIPQDIWECMELGDRLHNQHGNTLYLDHASTDSHFVRRGIWKRLIDLRIDYARRYSSVARIWTLSRGFTINEQPAIAPILVRYGFNALKTYKPEPGVEYQLLELLPPFSLPGLISSRSL